MTMADIEIPAGDEPTAKGLAWWAYVTRKPPPAMQTPVLTVGTSNFVCSEVWSRPGLDHRARRFISLTCTAIAGVGVPIRSHIYSALKSGDISLEEMREFALHLAVYAGWPKAAELDGVISEQWEKVQSEGGPEKLERPRL
jgi:4-carboxymuconolactone decarboxylase